METKVQHTLSFTRDEIIALVRAHLKSKKIKFAEEATFDFRPNSHSDSVQVTWDEGRSR